MAFEHEIDAKRAALESEARRLGMEMREVARMVDRAVARAADKESKKPARSIMAVCGSTRSANQ